MSAQAGWYDDPNGNTEQLRYWDGNKWTDKYAPKQDFVQDTGAQPQQTQQTQQSAQSTADSCGSIQYQSAASTTYAQATEQATYTNYGQIYPMTEADRTLRLIAFIWNILCTLGCAVLIIPLAWMIPMTVHSYGIYKGTKPNTVVFGVCTLLFVGMVSGILLLCSNKER